MVNDQYPIPNLTCDWTPWPELVMDFFIKQEPYFSLEDQEKIELSKQQKQFQKYRVKIELETDESLPLYLRRPIPELVDPTTYRYKCRKNECQKTFKTLHCRGRHELKCKFFRQCIHCKSQFKKRSALLKHQSHCSMQYQRIFASNTSMG